jgi:hypothetical protein
MQLIRSLATGEKFLDEFQPLVELPRTHYVSLDRPPEELGAKLDGPFSALKGCITSESLFPYLRELRSIEVVLQRIPSDVELLCLDGIGFIVEGKKLIEQRQIGILMSDGYNWCSQKKATLNLAHHTAKAKVGQGYSNAREAAAGSGAWAQTAGLSTYISPEKSDDVTNPHRNVAIMQNHCAGRVLQVTMTPTGLIRRDQSFGAEQLTESRNFGREEIRDLYPAVSDATLTRWIDDWIKAGYFTRIGHGRFQGFLPPPSIS